jgi:hypothetical protein
MNPYRKIKPGDVLPAYPAAFHNDVLDMLGWFKANRNAMLLGGSGGLGLESARTLVPIKNDSGNDLDRFAVVRVTDFLFGPGAGQTFKNRPAFKGGLPAASTHEKFAILQEPLKDGKIGLALLSGVTACQVDIAIEAHSFADTIQDDAEKLRSCLWGPVEILARQGGTGPQWCYVSLCGFRRAARFRGLLHTDIDQDDTGNAYVYTRIDADTYADSGEMQPVLNDLDADLEAGAIVEVVFEGLDENGDPLWRITQADYECPE